MERPNVVLVTGASTGIGRAVAIEMRGRGWRVFATVRRRDDVIDLTQLGRGLIEPLIMDVTDQESVERAIQTVKERAGRLDALVNNAGIAIAAPMELLSAEELSEQLDVNVVGTHRVTRAALPLLRESRGRIVQISSVGGEEVMPFNGAYSASKHALEALSDALRMELHGIVKVIVIQPGAIRTPIWQKAAGPGADILRFANEHYPAGDIERIARVFMKSGQRGADPKLVAEAVGNALELPWPLPRWVVVAQGKPMIYLMRLIPSFIKDRLKLRMLGWKPRG